MPRGIALGCGAVTPRGCLVTLLALVALVAALLAWGALYLGDRWEAAS